MQNKDFMAVKCSVVYYIAKLLITVINYSVFFCNLINVTSDVIAWNAV